MTERLRRRRDYREGLDRLALIGVVTPEQEAAFRDLVRRFSDAGTLFRGCPHRLCARARRCAHPRLSCYRNHEDFWRDRLFPYMRAVIRRRVEAGPDGTGGVPETE